MIDSKEVLYSKGKSDENYTPSYAVKPILKYIKPDAVVWCPFDTIDSEFVKLISNTNIVHFSHIEDGGDFFDFEPPFWDVLISNPPFTNKRKIFERALSFGKPFALLMTNTWLNDKYSKWVFKEADRQMQLLMFDKRVHFIKPDGNVETKTTFSSSYFCSDFLFNNIEIEALNYE